MTRREVVAFVAAAAAFRPLVGAAQGPAKQYRIAFVHSGIPANQLTETAGPFWVRRFFEALRALGYVEGRDLLVERYSAESHYDRFPALAYQVVAGNPDVIVANSNQLVQAFREATTTIPILGVVGDPVHSGLVKSLARPEGNVTGVSIDAGIEVWGKLLQILKAAIPSAAKVAFLTSRDTWDGTAGKELRNAGEHLGVSSTGILPTEVNPAQLRRAFAEIAQQGLDAVVVGGEGTFLANRRVIVELAAEYRIAVLYPYREYVEQGGLMAYGPDLGELAQHLADDVHRILHGAKPGDLPVYQPSKFELVVNLKTAEALGLTVPLSILSRADEVIE
jgi:putative tryptophan/tyrosine transport system substrate-binding protein